MALNLSAQKIEQWQSRVDEAISQKLVVSLKEVYTISTALKGITDTVDQDENNLSYRFNDLAKLSEQAASKLTTFMESFDSSLKEYISTVKKSEASTAEKVLEKIDNFAEAAAKIEKLKM